MPCQTLEAALPKTFNDNDLLRSGEGVCVACVSYLRAAGRGKTLRSSHLVVCSKKIRQCSTGDIFNFLSEPSSLPDPPFFITVCESYKKHLTLRARVATNRDRFPVTLEQETQLFARDMFSDCAILVYDLLSAGWNRSGILSGKLNPARIKTREEMEATKKYVQRIRKYIGTFLFRLAVRVTPRPDKEEGND